MPNQVYRTLTWNKWFIVVFYSFVYFCFSSRDVVAASHLFRVVSCIRAIVHQSIYRISPTTRVLAYKLWKLTRLWTGLMTTIADYIWTWSGLVNVALKAACWSWHDYKTEEIIAVFCMDYITTRSGLKRFVGPYTATHLTCDVSIYDTHIAIM